jgi:hypothetical protein
VDEVSGGATDVHWYELAASFEVTVSTVSEWKSVHAEISGTAQIVCRFRWRAFSACWPVLPLAGNCAWRGFLRLAFKRNHS